MSTNHAAPPGYLRATAASQSKAGSLGATVPVRRPLSAVPTNSAAVSEAGVVRKAPVVPRVALLAKPKPVAAPASARASLESTTHRVPSHLRNVQPRVPTRVAIAHPAAKAVAAPVATTTTTTAPDLVRAREFILDAKVAETKGNLREALTKYREALRLMPPAHSDKLRAKIAKMRDALALQNAATSVVAAAAPDMDHHSQPVATMDAAATAQFGEAADSSARPSASPVVHGPAIVAGATPPIVQDGPAAIMRRSPEEAVPRRTSSSFSASPAAPGETALVAAAGAATDSGSAEGSTVAPASVSTKFAVAGASILEESLLALLNVGDEKTLLSLPQIGKKRAETIIRERSTAPFATVEDLSRIGLSDKQIETFRAAFAKSVAEGKLAIAAAVTASKSRTSM